MNVKAFALITALAVLWAVIDLIRREKMTFKFSMAWFLIAVIVAFFAFYDKVLYHLAALAGFSLPSNFIFFILLVFFIFLSLFLTIYINEQNNRSETLAQSLAILEFKLKELQKTKKE
jgi:hypothetical protein